MSLRRHAIQLGNIYAILCVSVALTSCATVVNGRMQTIHITSSPTKASVLIDSIASGSTPISVELTRHDSHTIRVERPGYLPYETRLIPTTNGWIFGNVPLVIIGLFGLFYDLNSGGAYDLTPDTVSPTLLQLPTGSSE